MKAHLVDTRGFALVNALVLVAALSAAAVFVLGRAEGVRLRQAHLQTATQASLYLDAFEAYTLTVLRNDQRGGPVDGPADGWAQRGQVLEIDRGRVVGDIIDLQGRFNVNWLANVEDVAAEAAFGRLLTRLSLRPGLASDVFAHLRQGRRSARSTLTPAVSVVGGPILLVEQLQQASGLRPREYDRLAPFLSALPSDSQINVNTAPIEVMQSLLPGAKAEALALRLQQRDRRPFQSLEDFLAQVSPLLGEGGIDPLDLPRFAVGSDWFMADIAVDMEELTLRRQTVFERRPLPFGPQVSYRVEGRK